MCNTMEYNHWIQAISYHSQSSLRIHVPSTYQHEAFEKHNKFKKESDTECKEKEWKNVKNVI